MNILFLTRQFPPRLGGVATASLRHAKALKNKGDNVLVVACDKSDQKLAYDAKPNFRVFEGINVYNFPEPLVKGAGYAFSYIFWFFSIYYA